MKCAYYYYYYYYYYLNLALTSPTGGGRSVGIVRSRTKATEFSLVYYLSCVCRFYLTFLVIVIFIHYYAFFIS